MDEAVAIGCVVPARLIGVLEAEQTETSGKNVRNDRLVAVIETEYNPPACRSIDQLPEQRLAEIEHFFVSYNQMEGRDFRWLARRGPAQAAEVVENGISTFFRLKGCRHFGTNDPAVICVCPR
jgi:inorganic pyrophosphatase